MKLRTALTDKSGHYRYDQTTLEGWFNFLANDVGRDLGMTSILNKPQMVSVHDERINADRKHRLWGMGIRWITVRDSGEANTISFFTEDMQLFHETYMVG